MIISSIDELRSIYNLPSERAINKDIGNIDHHCKNFIENSPFCVISTHSSEGKEDVSPRGGNRGFVKVIDESTLLVPDARGNNRLDCLMNIIETGRIGMLFFIPGIDETLRVNGSVSIHHDQEKLALFADDDMRYLTVLEIKVEEAFLHCAKAFMRSKLWDKSSKIDDNEFPSMGEMLKDQLKSDGPAEKRSETKKRYQSEL